MNEEKVRMKEILYRLSPLAVWGVIGVVVYIVITVFFVPKIQEVMVLRDEIATKQVQLEDKQEYGGYLERLEGNPIKLEAELVHYALPSKNDVISLIITYEGLSRYEGISLSPLVISPGLISDEEVNPAPVNPSVSRMKDVVFTMDATAKDWDTAIAFLKEMYRVRRLLHIDQMSWQIDSEGNILMSLAIRAFYYPDVSSVGTEELVKIGMVQESFIAELQNTITYDQYILDAVRVGKEDLFSYSSLPEPK